MAPKKITGYVKLQIMAGKATPAPPVGPALGQAQVNIMEFCKQFNDRTKAPRSGWTHHPGRHQRLRRPHLQLHHQDASGSSAAAEGRRHREGLRHSEQGEEGQGHREADPRHRHPEDAGHERRPRSKRQRRPFAALPAPWASKSSPNFELASQQNHQESRRHFADGSLRRCICPAAS